MTSPRSRSSSSFTSLYSLQNEPELRQSTKDKISMLPGLKRQQKLQQGTSSETTIQSSSHSYESLKNDNDPALKKIRYTITSRSTSPPSEIPSSSPVSVNDCSHQMFSHDARQANPAIDFTVHAGEQGITRSPAIGNDPASRLNGLRQFREWSARIQKGSQAGTETSRFSDTRSNEANATSSRSHVSGSPVQLSSQGTISEQCSPPHWKSDIVEKIIDAPTPLSSPQVTPFGIRQTDHATYSNSPPGFDLHSAFQPKPAEQLLVNPRTLVITSGLQGSSQLATPSSSTDRHVRTQSVEGTSSSLKPHPPVSFPRDFYERFPILGGSLGDHPQSIPAGVVDSRKTTPCISPKTKPALPQGDDELAQDLEPLSIQCDGRGRPTFYDTIHYFTECPHASPPANRPIDPVAQPRPHLDFHPYNAQITRSVIPGACFNCDTAQRRDQEMNIMEGVTSPQIVRLTQELSVLLDQLELVDLDEQVAEDPQDRHLAQLLGPHSFDEDKDDLDNEIGGIKGLPPISDDWETTRFRGAWSEHAKGFPQYIVGQVRDLEAQIDSVQKTHEEQIKKIWAGYTPRWGPATLGVQRRSSSVAAQHSRLMDTVRRSVHTCRDILDNNASDVEVVKPDSEKSSSQISSMSETDFKVPSHSSSLRSHTPMSISSLVSERDQPGSRQPGEGKMRVGWIRE